MKKYLIIALALSLSFTVKAQFLVVFEHVSAKPITVQGLEKSTSNPYLYNETFKGKIILVNNKEIEDINVLYDLILDIPVFVDHKGVFLKLNETPKQFELLNPKKGLQVYKCGYPPIAKFNEATFYEVLEDGKAQLLKKSKKSFTESIPYGTKDVVKEAIITEAYYLYEGGQIKKITKDVKSLMSALRDKKINLATNLDTLKSGSKSNEKIMIALVNKYNSSK